MTQETISPTVLRQAIRWSASTGKGEVQECHLAVEDILTIDVKDVGSFTVTCTPVEVIPLAVGFAFSEGIIESVDNVYTVARCLYEPNVIRMQIDDPSRAKLTGRNLIVSSSCGLCGGQKAVEDVLSGMKPVLNTLTVNCEMLHAMMARMSAQQQLFSTTGGTHAAAIFSPEGEILSCAEDVGRHNALDKAIGKCLLERRPTAGCGVVLSGRTSLEMITKAGRAGIEVIAAVSAPSSLGVQAAERLNVTLCCFVRGERATVFTHPERVERL